MVAGGAPLDLMTIGIGRGMGGHVRYIGGLGRRHVVVAGGCLGRSRVVHQRLEVVELHALHLLLVRLDLPLGSGLEGLVADSPEVEKPAE